MVNFKVSYEDFGLISRIADRTLRAARAMGVKLDAFEVQIDITAAHANGCPLRLAELLAADDFNFSHDTVGIMRHLNRDTGQLENFVPRYARREAA